MNSVLSFLTRPTDSQIREILSLYRVAGWWQSPQTGVDDAGLVRGIVRGSHCFVIATAGPAGDGQPAPLVGMGRSISDGVSDAYIQDVVVAPDHRRNGIATRIIECIVRRLRGDGIDWIGLIAEPDTQNLYRPLGFEPMAGASPMLYRKK